MLDILLQRCKRRTTGVKPFYMIIDLLLVRIDHFQKAVVTVIGPLRHIGGNRLIGHNQRAVGLGDFAHLAVEVFDGTRPHGASGDRCGSARCCVRRSNTSRCSPGGCFTNRCTLL